MRRPGSMRGLEALGRVRLSPNFFFRDFLYSEIADFHGRGGIEIEGSDEIVFIFRPRLGCVRRDDNRVSAEAAIEGPVRFQKKFKSLHEGDVFREDTDRSVLDAGRAQAWPP